MASRRISPRPLAVATRHALQEMQGLSIEILPTEALTLDSQNPRKHSKRQIKKLARSIKSFGFISPIITDRWKKILVGNGRFLAGQTVGMREFPCICVDSLTPAQARAFAIADNRLHDESEWDDRLLGEIFRELSAAELDFSLEETGFSMAEIDLRIEGLTATAEGQPDPADTIPLDSGPPVSRVGDLWICGRHYIYCGDALDSKSYAALMRGKKASIVVTDPPYGVRINHVSGLGRIKHREFVMGSAGMQKAELRNFLTQAMKLLVMHSMDGSIHAISMDWRGALAILEAGREAYTELKNICAWVKENAGMGSLYRSQHELYFIFKSGKQPHANHVQLGRFGRNRTNVWKYAGMTSVQSRSSDEGNLLALHPTVKPVRLVADALLDCSSRGDIVLDPFLGSGTTLIAAERVGRVAYCMELDPLYVDAAVRRFEAYTGQRARHAVTGKAFGTPASRRGRAHV